MTAKEMLLVIAVILLIPVGAYLKRQAYNSLHGGATIREDIDRLIQTFREWREERKLNK